MLIHIGTPTFGLLKPPEVAKYGCPKRATKCYFSCCNFKLLARSTLSKLQTTVSTLEVIVLQFNIILNLIFQQFPIMKEV